MTCCDDCLILELLFPLLLCDKWYPELILHCPNTPTILIGTKLDLHNDIKALEKLKVQGKTPISYERGLQLANDSQVPQVLCLGEYWYNRHYPSSDLMYLLASRKGK